MQVKFSEDVVPISDLKINPGKVVNRAQDTHRPIPFTSRGRGMAFRPGVASTKMQRLLAALGAIK